MSKPNSASNFSAYVAEAVDAQQNPANTNKRMLALLPTDDYYREGREQQNTFCRDNFMGSQPS